MNNTTLMTALATCILFIGAKMYPYLTESTEMIIEGTRVIFLGDSHLGGGSLELEQDMKNKLNAIHSVLESWVTCSTQRTLFLIEVRKRSL